MKSLQFVAGSTTTKFVEPNEFILTLPRNGYRTSGSDECAMSSMTLQYSWPNISATLGNNAFSYMLGAVEYPVVMGDGIWQFSDIRDYLQQVMAQNLHYLIDASGQKVYYLDFIVNPVLYCLSLTVKRVPTVLPAGWTNPGITLGAYPQLKIPAGFTTVSGFAAGLYPAVPTALYQVNSGIPQITGVTSLRVLSDMVGSSELSLESGVLATFSVPSGQEAGAPIQLEPSNPMWVGVQKGVTITEISVRIVDQLRRPVTIRDPAGFVMIINIRSAN